MYENNLVQLDYDKYQKNEYQDNQFLYSHY